MGVNLFEDLLFLLCWGVYIYVFVKYTGDVLLIKLKKKIKKTHNETSIIAVCEIPFSDCTECLNFFPTYIRILHSLLKKPKVIVSLWGFQLFFLNRLFFLFCQPKVLFVWLFFIFSNFNNMALLLCSLLKGISSVPFCVKLWITVWTHDFWGH